MINEFTRLTSIEWIIQLYHALLKSVYEKLLTMSNTIKLFQSTIVYYKALGICPTKPNQIFSFDHRSICILLTLLVDFLSTATFFFFKAETYQEYSDSFYVSSSAFNFIVCFAINFWKMSNILKLIEKYEEFYQKSKFYDNYFGGKNIQYKH